MGRVKPLQTVRIISPRLTIRHEYRDSDLSQLITLFYLTLEYHIAYGETLAKEVAPFNIRVLPLIPGGFHTHGKGGNPVTPPPPGPGFEDYMPLYKWFKKLAEGLGGTQIGDPDKFATLIVDVVRGEGIMLEGNREAEAEDGNRDEKIDGEGRVRPWPERLVVGSDAIADIKATFKSWEQSMDEYGDLARSTDREKSDM